MFCCKCQPFVHIYYCLYDSSAELRKSKTHSTQQYLEKQESAWWPIKATQLSHLLSGQTQPAPCTALHCVCHCCDWSLPFWTVSHIVTDYLCVFIFILYTRMLYSFVRCFLFWVFWYFFVNCFSFCIQLSLYQFCTSLPTTANWWKLNFSQ